MASHLLAVTFDAHDPTRLARFWADLLGRETRDDPRGPLLLGEPGQLGLRFARSDAGKAVANRMHLHLTSATPADQQATVDRVLELGGRHIDVGQLPEEGHVVLADPEGNELCVIEAGNAFLAGTGFLGELACDGTRDVGVFWSEALGWPLVWDSDEETAVQSPLGGTKVAWGGPPVEPRVGRNRQRLDLVVDRDPEAETDRLVGLGATRLGPSPDGGGAVELADPDGNEFTVSVAR
ncbi:putative enzyme related to lactoylglutathione lyase [Mumia flava]|uniref:Putative enzyme related to lactoylglutathione lyase n=1 Tax=Mumia flava TaxID=1348852 RepID=A0A0B2B6W8_9ACTN|nr:VOC family protein [Mumia flava]PJJ57743.1 putative enzyme related to lactoylglutathione lyase [Mumia flava]